MSSKAALTFDSLPRFVEAAEFLNVVIAAEGTERPIIQRVNVTDDVITEFRTILTRELRGNEDTIIRAYEAGYKPEQHEVEYVRADDESVEGLIESVSDVANIELFTGDDTVVDLLRFNAIVVTDNAREKAIAFRVFTSKQELTRSRWIGLARSQGTYNQVDTKVFLFERRIDCIAFDGYVFIFNVNNFQKIFGYLQQLRERGRELAEAVCQTILISNGEQFVATCERNAAMITKLATITEKPYFQHLTITDIEKVIKHHNLEVVVEKVKGKKHLVFDNRPGRRWDILKILDDAYLTSIMTKEDYEVNSKRRVGQQ